MDEQNDKCFGSFLVDLRCSFDSIYDYPAAPKTCTSLNDRRDDLT